MTLAKFLDYIIMMIGWFYLLREPIILSLSGRYMMQQADITTEENFLYEIYIENVNCTLGLQYDDAI